MTSEVRFLTAGGRTLEYSWVGPRPGAAPTLVFLHHGLGCRATWRDFPGMVAQATGCGALVYSRGGYGASETLGFPWPSTFMHDEALEFLPALLRATGVTEHVLVGHSDGASIAIIYAGGRNTAGLRGVVLMAPHVFLEEVTLRSVAAAAEAFQQTDMADKLRRWHGANTESAFWGWSRTWLDPGLRDWNVEEYLPHIQVPVLVIQGEHDEYGTVEQVWAVERHTRAEALVIPECGHSPFQDQPQVTLEAITRFVGRALG